MILHSALELEDVTTGNVTLVPTKKFFKPVVVLTAPISLEQAKLIGVEYLFDQNGNPHKFEGSHKVAAGDISGAVLVFHSKQSGRVELKTEKVTSLSCEVEEKTGMSIRFSAHLPDSEDELSTLVELLHFLKKLNKDAFQVTVNAQQTSLLDERQPLSKANATELKFAFKIARRPGLQGSIYTMPYQAGFIGGWECRGIGLKSEEVGGLQMAGDSRKFESEIGARDFVVSELFFFVKHLTVDGLGEVKAVGDLSDWCINLCPRLKKEEPEPAESTQ